MNSICLQSTGEVSRLHQPSSFLRPFGRCLWLPSLGALLREPWGGRGGRKGKPCPQGNSKTQVNQIPVFSSHAAWPLCFPISLPLSSFFQGTDRRETAPLPTERRISHAPLPRSPAGTPLNGKCGGTCKQCHPERLAARPCWVPYIIFSFKTTLPPRPHLSHFPGEKTRGYFA